MEVVEVVVVAVVVVMALVVDWKEREKEGEEDLKGANVSFYLKN